MNSLRSDLKERFFYRGNAFAIGGYMNRPHKEIIETQASSVLPNIGGGTRAEVADYRYRDLISFSSARSKTLGNMEERDGERIYNTLSTVTVENLNIADLITADRVVGRLVSERHEGQKELPMLPVGSYISNLRIAGEPVELPTHTVLFRAATVQEISEQRDNGALDGMGGALDIPRLEGVDPMGGGRRFEDHQVLTSLYSLPRRLPSGSQSGKTHMGEPLYPWGIHIRGFGTVYFGEFMITRYSRRLTMIRLDLGSPEDGEVSIVSTDGNGCTYP